MLHMIGPLFHARPTTSEILQLRSNFLLALLSCFPSCSLSHFLSHRHSFSLSCFLPGFFSLSVSLSLPSLSFSFSCFFFYLFLFFFFFCKSTSLWNCIGEQIFQLLISTRETPNFSLCENYYILMDK